MAKYIEDNVQVEKVQYKRCIVENCNKKHVKGKDWYICPICDDRICNSLRCHIHYHNPCNITNL